MRISVAIDEGLLRRKAVFMKQRSAKKSAEVEREI